MGPELHGSCLWPSPLLSTMQSLPLPTQKALPGCHAHWPCLLTTGLCLPGTGSWFRVEGNFLTRQPRARKGIKQVPIYVYSHPAPPLTAWWNLGSQDGGRDWGELTCLQEGSLME